MKTLLLIISCLLLFVNLEAQTKVKVYTSFGDFTVYLEDTLAPITAGNFKDLVERNFYDSVLIHRVVPNFVIQGGDATRTGGTTPPVIQDEFSPLLSNVQKTLSMANAGANTGTSQFFVNLRDNTGLDYNKSPFTSAHPVFGAVIDGWSVVETIGQQPNSGQPNNVPNTPILMDSIRVLPPPLSVPIYNQNAGIKVFPNPANNFLTIKSESSSNYSLHNLSGQLVLEGSINASDFFEKKIDLKSLPNGIYNLNIQSQELLTVEKLIISH